MRNSQSKDRVEEMKSIPRTSQPQAQLTIEWTVTLACLKSCVALFLNYYFGYYEFRKNCIFPLKYRTDAKFSYLVQNLSIWLRNICIISTLSFFINIFHRFKEKKIDYSKNYYHLSIIFAIQCLK